MAAALISKDAVSNAVSRETKACWPSCSGSGVHVLVAIGHSWARLM